MSDSWRSNLQAMNAKTKQEKQNYTGNVTPTCIVSATGPFKIKLQAEELSQETQDPAFIVRYSIRNRKFRCEFDSSHLSSQVLKGFREVYISETMWMRWPKTALTWNKKEQNWIALNSYMEKGALPDSDPTKYSMKLCDWLEDPGVKVILEDEKYIKDFVFMNDKGVRITEEDAIALNDQFNVDAPPVARRRVFALPPISANANNAGPSGSQYQASSTGAEEAEPAVSTPTRKPDIEDPETANKNKRKGRV
jgi:hypothetical protein